MFHCPECDKSIQIASYPKHVASKVHQRIVAAKEHLARTSITAIPPITSAITDSTGMVYCVLHMSTNYSTSFL